MSIPSRGELLGYGPLGQLLERILDAIQDELQTSPIRIGAVHVYSGVGTPNGVKKGRIGDLYLRTDGGASTTLYVKESGTDTLNGWVAK